MSSFPDALNTSALENPTAPLPTVVLDPHALDRLTLLRRGLLDPESDLLDSLRHPGTSITVLCDPEGAHLAELQDDQLIWGAEPTPRPFQDAFVTQNDRFNHALVLRGEPTGEPDLTDIDAIIAICSPTAFSPADENATASAARALGLRNGIPFRILPISGRAPRAAELSGRVLARVAKQWIESPMIQRSEDRGTVVLFTGLSGSGKSTLANALAASMVERGKAVTLLDGDAVRRVLSSELGFSPIDRSKNVRRVGWVATEIARHGGLAICAFIAPYETDRSFTREMTEAAGANFVEIHVSTPLEVCESRDPKGLYVRARSGIIPEFTGLSAPYEVPETPNLRIDTSKVPAKDAVDRILALLGLLQ